MGELAMQAGQAAINTGSGFLGSILGLATAGINDRRQLRQQDKLNEQAYEINNRMAEENYKREMRKWEETNYSAQLEQLQKAGLNPGLLYGMSGGGGATAQTQGGQGVSAGQAPSGGGEIMGMTMAGLQARMMQAQIKVMESQANKNNTEAAYTGGVQTEATKKGIESLTQGIENMKIEAKLKGIQTAIAELETDYQAGTLEQRIANVSNDASIIMARAKSALAQADIDEVTKEDKIKTVHVELIGTILRNGLTKAQTVNTQQQTKESASRIEVNEQTIHNMAVSIEQKWQELENTGKRINNETKLRELQQFIHDMPQGDMMDKAMLYTIGGGILNLGTSRGIPKRSTTIGTSDRMGDFESYTENY